MTSTNDGTDVKDNTNASGGKTQLKLIFQTINSCLVKDDITFEERSTNVCAAWKQLYKLSLYGSTDTREYLLDWAHKHTAELLLQNTWQLEKYSYHHGLLVNAIEECHGHITSNGKDHKWLKDIWNRGEFFKKLTSDVWGNATLNSLMKTDVEPVDNDTVFQWLSEERGSMFVCRVRQLAASKCYKRALNLVSNVLNRCRLPTLKPQGKSDENQDVKKQDLTGIPSDPGGSHKFDFLKRLKMEAGFTDDVVLTILDAELVLLHKVDDCIEALNKVAIVQMPHLVERLHDRSVKLKQYKLWRNANEVALIAAQLCVTRCMSAEVCAGDIRSCLCESTLSLLKWTPKSRLREQAIKMAQVAATSYHLLTFAIVIKQNSSEDMHPFVCEMYVIALTVAMNELEKLKSDTKSGSTARQKLQQSIAFGFLELAELLQANAEVRNECILTAFSVHPSMEIYDKVVACPKVSIKKSIEDQEIECQSEFGSWSTDSKPIKSLYYKTSETLEINWKVNNKLGVLSPAVFDCEGLNFSKELCEDLAVLLRGARLKTLSWDMDRDQLLDNCKAYMQSTGCGKHSMIRELRYLNIDPSTVDHLPSDDEDLDENMYYGIEKGYEHHVLEASQPTLENDVFNDRIDESQRSRCSSVESVKSGCCNTSNDSDSDYQSRRSKSQESIKSLTKERKCKKQDIQPKNLDENKTGNKYADKDPSDNESDLMKSDDKITKKLIMLFGDEAKSDSDDQTKGVDSKIINKAQTENFLMSSDVKQIAPSLVKKLNSNEKKSLKPQLRPTPIIPSCSSTNNFDASINSGSVFEQPYQVLDSNRYTDKQHEQNNCYVPSDKLLDSSVNGLTLSLARQTVKAAYSLNNSVNTVNLNNTNSKPETSTVSAVKQKLSTLLNYRIQKTKNTALKDVQSKVSSCDNVLATHCEKFVSPVASPSPLCLLNSRISLESKIEEGLCPLVELPNTVWSTSSKSTTTQKTLLQNPHPLVTSNTSELVESKLPTSGLSRTSFLEKASVIATATTLPTVHSLMSSSTPTAVNQEPNTLQKLFTANSSQPSIVIEPQVSSTLPNTTTPIKTATFTTSEPLIASLPSNALPYISPLLPVKSLSMKSTSSRSALPMTSSKLKEKAPASVNTNQTNMTKSMISAEGGFIKTNAPTIQTLQKKLALLNKCLINTTNELGINSNKIEPPIGCYAVGGSKAKNIESYSNQNLMQESSPSHPQNYVNTTNPKITDQKTKSPKARKPRQPKVTTESTPFEKFLKDLRTSINAGAEVRYDKNSNEANTEILRSQPKHVVDDNMHTQLLPGKSLNQFLKCAKQSINEPKMCDDIPKTFARKRYMKIKTGEKPKGSPRQSKNATQPAMKINSLNELANTLVNESLPKNQQGLKLKCAPIYNKKHVQSTVDKTKVSDVNAKVNECMLKNPTMLKLLQSPATPLNTPKNLKELLSINKGDTTIRKIQKLDVAINNLHSTENIIESQKTQSLVHNQFMNSDVIKSSTSSQQNMHTKSNLRELRISKICPTMTSPNHISDKKSEVSNVNISNNVLSNVYKTLNPVDIMKNSEADDLVLDEEIDKDLIKEIEELSSDEDMWLNTPGIYSKTPHITDVSLQVSHDKKPVEIPPKHGHLRNAKLLISDNCNKNLPATNHIPKKLEAQQNSKEHLQSAKHSNLVKVQTYGDLSTPDVQKPLQSIPETYNFKQDKAQNESNSSNIRVQNIANNAIMNKINEERLLRIKEKRKRILSRNKVSECHYPIIPLHYERINPNQYLNNIKNVKLQNKLANEICDSSFMPKAGDKRGLMDEVDVNYQNDKNSVNIEHTPKGINCNAETNTAETLLDTIKKTILSGSIQAVVKIPDEIDVLLKNQAGSKENSISKQMSVKAVPKSRKILNVLNPRTRPNELTTNTQSTRTEKNIWIGNENIPKNNIGLSTMNTETLLSRIQTDSLRVVKVTQNSSKPYNVADKNKKNGDQIIDLASLGTEKPDCIVIDDEDDVQSNEQTKTNKNLLVKPNSVKQVESLNTVSLNKSSCIPQNESLKLNESSSNTIVEKPLNNEIITMKTSPDRVCFKIIIKDGKMRSFIKSSSWPIDKIPEVITNNLKNKVLNSIDLSKDCAFIVTLTQYPKSGVFKKASNDDKNANYTKKPENSKSEVIDLLSDHEEDNFKPQYKYENLRIIGPNQDQFKKIEDSFAKKCHIHIERLTLTTAAGDLTPPKSVESDIVSLNSNSSIESDNQHCIKECVVLLHDIMTNSKYKNDNSLKRNQLQSSVIKINKKLDVLKYNTVSATKQTRMSNKNKNEIKNNSISTLLVLCLNCININDFDFNRPLEKNLDPAITVTYKPKGNNEKCNNLNMDRKKVATGLEEMVKEDISNETKQNSLEKEHSINDIVQINESDQSMKRNCGIDVTFKCSEHYLHKVAEQIEKEKSDIQQTDLLVQNESSGSIICDLITNKTEIKSQFEEITKEHCSKNITFVKSVTQDVAKKFEELTVAETEPNLLKEIKEQEVDASQDSLRGNIECCQQKISYSISENFIEIDNVNQGDIIQEVEPENTVLLCKSIVLENLEIEKRTSIIELINNKQDLSVKPLGKQSDEEHSCNILENNSKAEIIPKETQGNISTTIEENEIKTDFALKNFDMMNKNGKALILKHDNFSTHKEINTFEEQVFLDQCNTTHEGFTKCNIVEEEPCIDISLHRLHDLKTATCHSGIPETGNLGDLKQRDEILISSIEQVLTNNDKLLCATETKNCANACEEKVLDTNQVSSESPKNSEKEHEILNKFLVCHSEIQEDAITQESSEDTNSVSHDLVTFLSNPELKDSDEVIVYKFSDENDSETENSDKLLKADCTFVEDKQMVKSDEFIAHKTEAVEDVIAGLLDVIHHDHGTPNILKRKSRSDTSSETYPKIFKMEDIQVCTEQELNTKNLEELSPKTKSQRIKEIVGAEDYTISTDSLNVTYCAESDSSLKVLNFGVAIDTKIRTYAPQFQKRKRKVSICKVETNPYKKRYKNIEEIEMHIDNIDVDDVSLRQNFNKIMNYNQSLHLTLKQTFLHQEEEDDNIFHKAWPQNLSKKPKFSIEKRVPIIDDEKYKLFEDLPEYYNARGTSSTINDTYNKGPSQKGFGDGSDRAIVGIGKSISQLVSAATLSDVKPQPQDIHEAHKTSDYSHRKNLFRKLLSIVEAFFNKTKAMSANMSFSKSQCRDVFNKIPGLYDIDFFVPAPQEMCVNVVQVGQLPVSAAAQNPVTCDSIVTHANETESSIRCSAENSPSRSPQENDYIELTNADLSTLPPMDQINTSLSELEPITATHETVVGLRETNSNSKETFMNSDVMKEFNSNQTPVEVKEFMNTHESDHLEISATDEGILQLSDLISSSMSETMIGLSTPINTIANETSMRELIRINDSIEQMKEPSDMETVSSQSYINTESAMSSEIEKTVKTYVPSLSVEQNTTETSIKSNGSFIVSKDTQNNNNQSDGTNIENKGADSKEAINIRESYTSSLTGSDTSVPESVLTFETEVLNTLKANKEIKIGKDGRRKENKLQSNTLYCSTDQSIEDMPNNEMEYQENDNSPQSSNSSKSVINILSQKVIKPADSGQQYQQQVTNVTFQKQNLNTLTLQQALAQLLPQQTAKEIPNELNQNSQPQVLHFVQGKSGNQLTLLESSQAGLVNNQNAAHVLHLIQNKASSSANNGNNVSTASSFGGLSIVDTGMQSGSQVLHLVNAAANQAKHNATAQLLKRVNLLTGLANVQGSNEQKMVQFLCKSADGKSLQLNTGHQRGMVLRLQPIDTGNMQHCKVNENSETNTKEQVSQSDTKSRSIYEDNFPKFVNTKGTEKSTSLPKFNQAFGKTGFDGKSEEDVNERVGNSLNNDLNNSQSKNEVINVDNIAHIGNPQLLIRKAPVGHQTQKPQQPTMNIQTMHGGVIYTRQIPVNIGGGQTINLITVPTTELLEDGTQKQQTIKFPSNENDQQIIKLVPQGDSGNYEMSTEDNTKQTGTNNSESSNQTPVLTQMRIKLPMLSKTPQMVSGARLVRPFLQIQRNMIGGANQPVYQQLVLTHAPNLTSGAIRFPQPHVVNQVKTQGDQKDANLSTSTLEQLREFDMVLEQVKERSTVQPPPGNFVKTSDVQSESVTVTSITDTPVIYSFGANQTVNLAYLNRKTLIQNSNRSPDSSETIQSPTSTQVVQLVTDNAVDSLQKKSKSKTKSRASVSPGSTVKANTVPPKPSSQKPLEDEQTTQRILYILAEYKEQVENSPDKDKPAPRRRSNPPIGGAAPSSGSTKRKKSSSNSKRPGSSSVRETSPVGSEDPGRTMGSEDSSCGTSQGDCAESCASTEAQSPQESPRKTSRKLTFEQEIQSQPTNTGSTSPRPQRNVIVADGQAIAVTRGAPGKPTAVLNYLVPVSMVKGGHGQQIAIVTNRGHKLLMPQGEGAAQNTLLLQRLIGTSGLKPILTRPGVRHVRLPTSALQNLQAINLIGQNPVQEASREQQSESDTPTMNLTESQSVTKELKTEDGSNSESSDVWRLPTGTDAADYNNFESPSSAGMDDSGEQTVLGQIQDQYSPDLETQHMFDKMFDAVDAKRVYMTQADDQHQSNLYETESQSTSEEKCYHQVVQKKEHSNLTSVVSHGSSYTIQHTAIKASVSGVSNLHSTVVSAAALRRQYAMLEHELRLQKSLSEECEDLGVDSPSASDLFPEADLLFAASPANIPEQDDSQGSIIAPLQHVTPTSDIEMSSKLSPDTERLLAVAPVLQRDEFARNHPNTTFHRDDGALEFTVSTGMSRPATVLATAPTIIQTPSADSGLSSFEETLDQRPNVIQHVTTNHMVEEIIHTPGDEDMSSPERFWESNDSTQCESGSQDDTDSFDSSHLGSVIKSCAPRTYLPARRIAGKRIPESSEGSSRRASNRGVVKRGCHCCNGSPVNTPKIKKTKLTKSRSSN